MGIGFPWQHINRFCTEGFTGAKHPMPGRLWVGVHGHYAGHCILKKNN
jgi:hypothetical protein